MNILVFSPFPSHPDTEGSRKRIFKLTKYLQNMGHIIHFVYFAQEGFSIEGVEAMHKEWDTFTLIEKIKPLEYGTEGYGLDDWYQDNIHVIVNELIEIFNIDMVFLNYIMQSKLLEYIPEDILKVIDAHDIFGDRHVMINKNVDYKYQWYSVSKKDEIKGLNRADIILAIQEKEATYFSSLIDKPVKTIRHLADSNFLGKNYNELKKIGFIGAWNDTNTTPIKKFIELFTHHKISKHTKLLIAGPICGAIKSEHASVVLMGVVEHLEDFYGEVDLVINPLTYGTGLNIKSVEALSFGVPFISTNVGFRGIDSDSPCHQLSTHEEMLDCIQKLHNRPQELSKLAQLSVNIFNEYEAHVKTALESLFDMKINSNKTKRKKQTKILLELYKKLQFTQFEISKREERKNIELKQKEKLIQDLETELLSTKNDLNEILDIIGIVVQHQAKYHPFKKYKAYKKMLKIFFGKV